ncbi:MAG TPA: carbohydrate-binding protein [Opitutaceae bacterium]|nr:carbohydrate-binding protein [Opitutaceae bacterium]
MKSLSFMLALMMAGALPTFAQVNVITQHNDIARTGQNLSETVLTPSNVNDSHFGLIHKIALDDQCFASPLVYTGLTIGGGVHNVVYMETVNNSVYALDATTGAQLWRDNFGTAPTGDCSNIQGKFGIMSTPVINPTNSCIYVVSMTNGAYGDGAGVLRYRLHKLDLATGNEDAGSPVVIANVANFNPAYENDRPALLNANGNVYVCFGSFCDVTPSNGHIFAFDAGTLAQTGTFATTVPGGSAYLASIWQSGQGPAADSSGNIYFLTGNGTWDGVNNFGMSILKMSPTLGLESYFTPNDYANLNNNDEDLSSAGCMVMPGTGYIVGGGKEGKIYVLNPASLGGISAGDANAIQAFQAVAPNAGNDTLGSGSSYEDDIHGSPAYFANSAGPAIYVWGSNDHGRCFQYTGGKFNPTASSVTAAVMPMTGGPGTAGGTFSISANGTTNGIAWAYGILSGDADSFTQPGVLYAYDANNLATQLWSSQDNPSRDSMGNMAKFTYPVIANGLVYISDFGTSNSGTGGLCIYGPISSGGGVATTPCLTSANSNIEGMVTDGTTFPNTGGFDSVGNAYSATMLGSSITWNGLSFSLLPANANNGASNETITLPAGQFSTLSLLGSGMGGGQTNQTITVHYTDGTSSTFTQSFSDWGIPSANYPGESTVLTMSYRDTNTGGRDTRSIYIYGYSFALNSAKTVSSLVLPANRFVGIIAAGLSGGTNALSAASANIEGMVTDGTTFPNTGGFDSVGNAYSATVLGSSITWNGLSFSLLPANANNGASNETVTLPAGQFSTLSLLGSGMGGGQTNQTIKVNYTDGTNSTFTQSFSDWGIPSANYPGESTVLTMSYRDTNTGGRDTRSIYLYGYSFALNSAKTVSSLVLPANRFVAIVGANLSGGGGGEGPYGGTAATIPGTVQAENYDTGGQGVAYNVTSINGTDNGYRSDGVDLEVCSDTGGGVNVGWESPGQWFKYTVNVATAGTYTVSFRIAAPGAVTDAFHLSNSSGTNLSGNVNLPATGGYQTWATVTANVTLPAGQQTLTLNEDNGGGVWNINSMSFATSGGGMTEQCSNLAESNTAGVAYAQVTGGPNGGIACTLSSTAVGQVLQFVVTGIVQGTTYDVKVGYRSDPSRGQCRLTVNGNAQPQMATLDEYQATSNWDQVADLGLWTAGAAGTTRNFTFTVSGKNAAATGYTMAPEWITLTPH